MREASSPALNIRPDAAAAEWSVDLHVALREAEDARNRADAANEAKSRLLATMSHEIRTPLNGIMGLVDLLAATDLQPEQRAYVDAVRTSGRSLGLLINEILDLSQIEAGNIVLNEAPFDLGLLVEGAIEILAPRAHAKGLDIASFVGADVPAQVIGDAARLRQVLLNLLGNSVKFTQRGGVGLRVTATRSGLRFAIADTGPGIAVENAQRIFEEFAQAGPREAEGAGLGLAISRQLAQRMGGRLALESTTPHGATFTLTLPLAAANDSHPRLAAFAGRCLIVSPSPFEASYLVEKLADLGGNVARASTLKSGLAAIAQAQATGMCPETLIVDCALGNAAALELAAAATAAGIARKLVLFTAAERRAFEAQTSAAFDGWLVKPLRLQSLLARLAAETTAPPPAKVSAPNDMGGRKILIAEDNDINALILEKYLRKAGAKPVRADDGLTALIEARAALAQEPFDAMILDLRMPGLDGLALAREIRRLEAAAGLPRRRLIAVSADVFAETKKQAYDAGIDVFLTKPIDFADLDAALADSSGVSR
jgi:CheY-like chemotaxis protein/nitrogen-specific signal transduction histidine kinase